MTPAEPVAAVPTDAALIAAWRGGDEPAAAELVRRHARALARFLAGAGALEADVDDLVQETTPASWPAPARSRRTWTTWCKRPSSGRPARWGGSAASASFAPG